MSRIPFMVWLLLFEVIADIGSKQFELTNSWYWYLAAFIAYMIGTMFWLWSMKNGIGLWRWTIIFGVISTISTLLIAFVWYKETVTTTGLIWIILCAVWLILIDWQ